MGMFAYRTPGVRFEWLDTQAQGIEPVRTDIAGFVGIAERGPLHLPRRVESWTEYTSNFGGFIPQAYLAYAVYGFFANGGQTCYVVRVADPVTARPASVTLVDKQQTGVLYLSAATPGSWGRALSVTVQRPIQERFSLLVQLAGAGQERFKNVTLSRLTGDGKPDPSFIETVVNDPVSGSRLICAMVADNASQAPVSGTFQLAGGADGLAALQASHWYGRGLVPESCAAAVPATVPTAQLGRPVDTTRGMIRQQMIETTSAVTSQTRKAADGTVIVTAQPIRPGSPEEQVTIERPLGIDALEVIDEIAVVAAPDLVPLPWMAGVVTNVCDTDTLQAQGSKPPIDDEPEYPPALSDNEIALVQGQLVANCERLGTRLAVLDLPHPTMTPTEALAWLARLPDSSYAAVYHPWLRVPDERHLTGLLRAVPPCGHIAGVYARVDNQVGVHKPPANELLSSAQDVTVAVSDSAYGDLNDGHVNALKVFPGRGLRVAGARTLSCLDPDRQYVNVRRLLLMIKQSIRQQTQWLVFEPNDPELWRRVDRVARAFLDGLWRRGWLDGASADEAYFVRCDETTNTPDEIDQGRMVCLIGVNPPWPAEFVVIRIGKTASGTQITEV